VVSQYTDLHSYFYNWKFIIAIIYHSAPYTYDITKLVDWNKLPFVLSSSAFHYIHPTSLFPIFNGMKQPAKMVKCCIIAYSLALVIEIIYVLMSTQTHSCNGGNVLDRLGQNSVIFRVR